MPGETGVTNQEYEWGNVRRYGVVGDGSGIDESTFMKNAIDSWNKVYVPVDIDVYAKELEIPSDKYIIIDGKITLYEDPANLVDGITIFKNSDQTNGNSNITICGNGELNAAPDNVTNWTGVEITQILYFVKCTNIKFSVKNILGSIYTEPNPSSSTKVAAIQFTDGENITVQNVFLRDWGREGINLNNSSNSIVSNIHAKGSDSSNSRSYSGVQVSGASASNNRISDIYVENAGASSVGVDSEFSVVNNIVSKNNRHQNGVNFGHSGKPANGTVTSNITVINAGTNGSSGKNYHGINVGNDTKDFSLSNVYIKTTYTHGINISNNGDNVRLNNIRIDGCGASGIRIYKANVWLDNTDISNCSGNGINIEHSTQNYMFNNLTISNSSGISFSIKKAANGTGSSDLWLNNCDFSSGNQGSDFYKYSSIFYNFLNVKLGDDDLFGGFSIASMVPGVLAQIYNSNVRERSRIIIEYSNAQAAAAEVYLKTRKDGFFEIGVGKSPASGAHVRYHIC